MVGTVFIFTRMPPFLRQRLQWTSQSFKECPVRMWSEASENLPSALSGSGSARCPGPDGALGGPSGREPTFPVSIGVGGGRGRVGQREREIGEERDREREGEGGREEDRERLPRFGDALPNRPCPLQTPRCGRRSTCGSGWSGR